jgi:hypothetical protein
MSKDKEEQPWISVKAGSQRVHFSQPFAETVGAEDGMRMVIAFTNREGEYQPWVGVVRADRSSTAPQIVMETSQEPQIRKVEDSVLAKKLEPYATDGERTRLVLSTESKEINHPQTEGTVRVYRLTTLAESTYAE